MRKKILSAALLASVLMYGCKQKTEETNTNIKNEMIQGTNRQRQKREWDVVVPLITAITLIDGRDVFDLSPYFIAHSCVTLAVNLRTHTNTRAHTASWGHAITKQIKHSAKLEYCVRAYVYICDTSVANDNFYSGGTYFSYNCPCGDWSFGITCKLDNTRD